ncbi:MAG TPA: ethylbenzene dehydrogenase-related protein [Alphaproteobacteria bacterium]|nr:ethylbenzene dehydrogenase-related protein [Alphaproteobacteria bacterium]
MRPRTDAATVVIHWTVAALFLISVITGFRIAADAEDAIWSRILAAVSLQGEVVIWHVWASWAMVAAAAAYIVFLFVSRLVPRVSVDASRVRAVSSHHRQTRWLSINVLIYWLAFIGLIVAIASGTVLYFSPEWASLHASPSWVTHHTVAAIHRVAAWSLVLYVFLHVGAQWAAGGLQALLKIMRPRLAYGRAAAVAAATTIGVLAGAYFADTATVRTLAVAQVFVPPRIDGETGDAAWRQARPVTVLTRNGANLPGGEAPVTLRAVHDGTYAYFLFEWPDPTRSQKHLPLRKTAGGWEVVERDYARQDEDHYYEDKFGVMLSRSSRLAALLTSHLGPQPAAGKPGPAGGRGLHYTTDRSIVDVWHWKSVRTGPMGQIDDNYFGPLMDPPADPAVRYTGGYTQDPKIAGNFIQNWKMLSGGRIQPLWLPRDLDVLRQQLGEVNLDPGASDSGEWWLPKELVLPYSADLDARFPVGTVIPSVVIEAPFEGDRGDVRAVGRWSKGWWRLEVSRKLDTGSKYDIAIASGVYMWVAVFDHTQTRHSQHLHPVQLELR